MIEFNITTSQLAIIWIFAGIVCMVPMFIQLTWKKFFIVPLVFLSVYLSFVTNKEFLGTPLYEKPQKFVHKYHEITLDNNQKWVTMWAMVDNKDRLYKFPYNKQMEQQLKKARERARQGRPTQGEFIPKNPGEKNPTETTKGGDLKIYDFPFQKMFPKDAAN